MKHGAIFIVQFIRFVRKKQRKMKFNVLYKWMCGALIREKILVLLGKIIA
jgi:hypothetical protein